MTISLIYATYSNSTALAVEVLATQLKNAGHTVEILQPSEVTIEYLQQSKLLVLASPSWDYQGQQGMPHEEFTLLHQRIGAECKLNKTAFAIMGLGDSSFTYYCGAVAHLTEWFTGYGGVQLVEPLKIDQYYINETSAEQAIAQWAETLIQAISTQSKK